MKYLIEKIPFGRTFSKTGSDCMANISVKVQHDNIDPVMQKTNDSINRALEMIGIEAEKFAKALCPVGTPESTGIAGYMGGTLRNSIAHQVVMQETAVYVGTNVKYAPYVELGTSKMAKRPYLKPAIEDHIEHYKQIISDQLGHM